MNVWGVVGRSLAVLAVAAVAVTGLQDPGFAAPAAPAVAPVSQPVPPIVSAPLDLGGATSQVGASDAPTMAFARPVALPKPPVFDPSTAVVTAQDAYSTTYTDAHGLHRVSPSVLPSNVLIDGKWMAAEGLLSPSAEGLTAARNAMRPVFAPDASGSEVFRTSWDGYTVSFQLVGAQASRAVHRSGVKQSIQVDSLSYAGVLPGVDLQYEVGPAAVKESMLLASAPARAPTYTWVVKAPGLTPSVDEFGNLVLTASDGTVEFTLAAPMMWDASGTADKGPAQAMVAFAVSKTDQPGAFRLTLSPDQAWLTDPARVYPVTVDPSVSPGADNIHSYKQGGLTGGTIQVGNSHQSSTCCNWRTVLHYNYEQLFGLHVVSADIYGVYAGSGTTTAYTGNVWWASAFSYDGVGNWLSSFPLDSAGYASDVGLGNQFAAWVAAGSASNYLMLTGAECSCYSYKNIHSNADIAYVYFPSVAGVTAASPQNGQVAPDMPIVQGVGNDPNGTGLNYQYAFTSSDGGRAFTSPWVGAGPYQVPSGMLDPGKHYSYTVSVVDGWNNYGGVSSVRSASNAAWTFKTNTPAPTPLQSGVSIQDGDVVSTLAPSIRVPTTTDPDTPSTPVKLDIRISTGSDGASGLVSTSGWLTPGTGASSVSWTPPAGLLQDGGSYTLSVLTDDGMDQGVNPSWVTHFKVNLRMGTSGPSPYDAAGPGMVNLANGNLALSFASPTVGTLGGAMGLSFAYNSLVPADQYKGLTGSYYNALNPGQTSTTSFDFTGRTPVLVRKDSQPTFDWGANAPAPAVPADYFLAKWTGYLTVPTAGTYRFGFTRGDGAKLTIGPKPGTSDPWTTAYNQWTTTSVVSDYTGSVQVAFDAQPRPVEIDYYEATDPATIHLYAQHLAADGVTWVDNGEVNSSWFTTSYQSLPYGWSASAPIVGGTSRYASATVTDSAITLTDTTGSVHTYMKSPSPSTGGYVPPAGETSTVALDGAGLITVTDGDGTITAFNAAGRVASVTTVADVTKPAAPTPTYDPATGRLTQIADPVTATITPSNPRVVSFEYSDGTSATCPQATGYTPAPAGMLCRITYPGHTVDTDTTRLYYNGNGQLTAIKDPGDATSTFGYDGHGRLVTLRGALQNDWLAADNTRIASATNAVTFGYDSTGRVSSVSLPAPDGVTAATQPGKTYTYNPNAQASTTAVDVAGLDLSAIPTTGRPAGVHAETVTYDSAWRQLTATSALNVTATKVWSSKDQLRSVTDSTGHQTVTVYDPVSGLPTDSYGPAPSSCFDNTPTDAGYLTLNGSCTAPLPAHAHTGYDEGLTGLNAATYPNATLTGAPTQLSLSAATVIPTSVGSMRMTGIVTFPAAGSYQLSAVITGGVRVWVGDVLELDAWGPHTGASVTGQAFTVDAAHLTQRFRLENQVSSGSGALVLNWALNGASATAVPAGVFHPAYNLTTSSTVDDSTSVSGATAPSAVKTTNYGSSPWLGQVASTTVDPTGLALTSSATYETTGWLRQLTSTSPAGAVSSLSYYGDTAQSPSGQTCAVTGTTITPAYQAGTLATATPPSPLLSASTIRDLLGRTIATRQGTTGAWGCVVYDARGRVTTTTIPSSATSAAYQVSTAYSVDGLTTTSTDSALTGNTTTSGVTTTVTDLLGRVTSATDLWGTVTTTTYDLAGRATTSTTHLAVDPVGTNHVTTFTYDQDGKVTSETVDGTSLATPTYNSAQLLQSVAYDNHTHLATIGYNAMSGATDSIGWTFASGAGVTDTVTRSQSGRIIADALTNGTTTGVSTYQFDTAGRLTGAVIPGHTLAYDYTSTSCAGNPNAGKDGLRVASKDTMGTTVVTQTGYCYNTAGQLTATTATAAPTGANPAIGTSLSTAAPTPSLVYDTRGNLTTFADETLTYDGANQHIGTTLTDGTTLTYLRDAGGRIIQSSTTPAGGGTPVIVRYTFAGGTPWGTLTATGALDKHTVSLPGGVLVTIPAAGLGSATWAYPDLHGNFIVTADHAGARAATCNAYDPFGQAIDPVTGLIGTKTADDAVPTTLTGTEDYGWAGGAGKLTEHAGDLATIEMGARQYVAALGLFLSPDPVAGGNTSWYNYPDDPINANDYSGQWSWADTGLVVGIVLLAVVAVVATVSVFGAGADVGVAAGEVALGAELSADIAAEAAVDVAADTAEASEGAIDEGLSAADEAAPPIKPGSAGGDTAGKRFPDAVRNQTLEENPNTCVYCRMKTERPQVDHSIPRSRGGNATPENAQTTCPWCNASKGARDFPVNRPPNYLGEWPPPWWKMPI